MNKKTINITSFINLDWVINIIDNHLNFKQFSFFEDVLKNNHGELNGLEYMVLGTAIDYLTRQKINKIVGNEKYESGITAEKSLNILKKFDLKDIGKIIDLKSLNQFVENSIIKYKNGAEDSTTIFTLARLDKLYRQGVFDYEMLFLEEQHLSGVYEDIYNNLDNLLKNLNLDQDSKINLNPEIFAELKNLNIVGDADIIIDDTLYEIKTSINEKITKKYIYQLIAYVVLGDLQVEYIGVINPRSTNIWKIKISDICNIEKIKEELYE